jgi:hypothetical protein
VPRRSAGLRRIIAFGVVFGLGEMFFAPMIPAILNDLAPGGRERWVRLCNR